MFDSEHGHLPQFLVDAVQHSIGPTSSAVEPGEFVAERTTDPVWILDQGAGDEIDHGCADRLGKLLGDGACRWTGHDEFVRNLKSPSCRRAQRAYRIDASHDIARGDGCFGLEQGSHGIAVAQQFECLFQAPEIVRADQDRRGSTIAGNDDTLVLAVDPVNEFGEPIFHVPERIGCRHGHDCATVDLGRQPSRRPVTRFRS